MAGFTVRDVGVAESPIYRGMREREAGARQTPPSGEQDLWCFLATNIHGARGLRKHPQGVVYRSILCRYSEERRYKTMDPAASCDMTSTSMGRHDEHAPTLAE